MGECYLSQWHAISVSIFENNMWHVDGEYAERLIQNAILNEIGNRKQETRSIRGRALSKEGVDFNC